METICLVREQVLCFNGEDQTKEQIFLVRKSEKDLKTELPPQFFATVPGAQENWNRNLEVKIMLPEVLPVEEDAVGSMQLEADQQDHALLQILNSLSMDDVTLTWEVTHFGYQNGPDEFEQISWMVEGVDIKQTRRLKTLPNGNPSHPRAYLCVKNFQNISAPMIAAWKNQKKFSGTFSVFLSISKSPRYYELAIKREHLANCRKMFEESVGADVELTCENELTVKCHTGMLSVCSEKLARMLQREKGKKKADFMCHYGLLCVRKLLEYVYYKDVNFVHRRVSIALEVLAAATEFQILGLVLHLQKYLAEKRPTEFSANEAVKLFVISKMGLEDNVSDGSGESEDEYSNSENYSGTEGSKYNEDEISDEHENVEDDYDTENDNGRSNLQKKRRFKRTYEQDNSQRKRNCVGYKGLSGPVCSDDVVSYSETSLVGNGNGIGSAESDEPTENNITKTEDGNNGITMDDVLDSRDSLEKQAVKNILWQRKYNLTGLLECPEYRALVGNGPLLLEITTIFAKSNE